MDFIKNTRNFIIEISFFIRWLCIHDENDFKENKKKSEEFLKNDKNICKSRKMFTNVFKEKRISTLNGGCEEFK